MMLSLLPVATTRKSTANESRLLALLISTTHPRSVLTTDVADPTIRTTLAASASATSHASKRARSICQAHPYGFVTNDRDVSTGRSHAVRRPGHGLASPGGNRAHKPARFKAARPSGDKVSRGCHCERARSTNQTWKPNLARRIAAIAPAGPAPTTATGVSVVRLFVPFRPNASRRLAERRIRAFSTQVSCP